MKVEVLEDGSGIKLLPEGWEENNILARMRIHGAVASSSGDGSINILDLSHLSGGNKQLILNMEEQATVAFALGVIAIQPGMPGCGVQSIMKQLMEIPYLHTSSYANVGAKAPPIPQIQPTKTVRATEKSSGEATGDIYVSDDHKIAAEKWRKLYLKSREEVCNTCLRWIDNHCTEITMDVSTIFPDCCITKKPTHIQSKPTRMDEQQPSKGGISDRYYSEEHRIAAEKCKESSL